MILKSILLKNFRIHKESATGFSENVNYIVGGNGQGKTTLLEAIYYLCTTKSHSTSSDSEALNFNSNEFEISGTFQGRSENNVRVYFTADENRKYFFVDGKQVHRASEIIGRYPVVMLTPEDNSITKGAPSERRKFVDSVISQASETYLSMLLDYNRTLRQRSSLLSQYKETHNRSLLLQFDAWSQRLAQTGSQIIRHRLKFISEFNSYLANSYNFIMEGSEKPGIGYKWLDDLSVCEDNKGNSGVNEIPAIESIEKHFVKMLDIKREEELRRASNLVGPHRDDFIFSINSVELKKYGSQGQNKTFQITLRFAQYFYLKDIMDIEPVFLMDDVFGELDAFRAGKISSYLNMIGQAFVTLTDLSDFSYLKKNKSDSVLRISEGKISYA